MVNVRQMESKVRHIMNLEPNQVKKEFKGKKLPTSYYHILEDANFHSTNTQLSKMGVFGPKQINRYPSGTVVSPKNYGQGQQEYDEYKKKGGRTWNIFDKR